MSRNIRKCIKFNIPKRSRGARLDDLTIESPAVDMNAPERGDPNFNSRWKGEGESELAALARRKEWVTVQMRVIRNYGTLKSPCGE